MSAMQTQAAVPLPPALQRYFEVALYLLVLTGFGTLASTGGLSLTTVSLVSVALLFRGYLLISRRSFSIPERWTTILTLGYVAFSLADYFLISSGFLSASVHLVLFVMVLRMFSAQRDRDYYFLAVLAFLMVLAAAVLTVDGTFLLAFAGFMMIAVVTFILMEMRHASAKATTGARESGDQRASRQMALSLSGASPALVLCILLGGTAIFFVMPRVATGYLSAYAPGSELNTGFSDRVELGRIGEIQQSSSVVMHVQIDGDPGGNFDLKWRGVALSDFDGKAWSTPREQHLIPRLSDGRFALWQAGAEERRSLSPQNIHYRVLMEPVGTNVFFLANAPLTLQGDYSLLARDGAGAVFDADPRHPITRYEATSNLPEPPPSGLRAAGENYPLDLALTYTRIPPLDVRIPRLAAEITANAGNNYDRALAVQNYLRTRFTYSLQLSRRTPRDPLAEFLFERKQGHCEYFASSMAVMLRTLGIPVRVVNGFRTGEFNDLTSQYVIRASNAHSWVEVYFPGYGWVSFDPTPASAVPEHSGWSRIALYFDAVASFWREWVINYDLNRQRTLGATVGSRSQQWLRELRRWLIVRQSRALGAVRSARDTLADAPLHWSVAAILAAILILLGANAARFWQAWQQRQLATHPERSPGRAASIWYQRMTRVLARRGWQKSPTQTPKEFLVCIEDQEIRRRVEQFTQHYANARFGDSAEDAQQLPGLYEEIETGAKR
ncbi:MAG TPA: DUF3488 and transglutaminase-like domain-containing protein [Terriglobales bacterium]|nr:DUF3488 and transglutaminase-like domain-containing protein [Terriglobales bacterium]